ncbi:DNA repair protein rhp7 [Smittium culicis]|uniref:DNA repair protein rhp7 n=1 Tax=Smittium culicis TaxID=133412 RepID=A0A1R1YMN2_9FUNG|nr:DNA repair protein rhp7 [Smittium culicis]OMJ28120.1 DNA repair protein rhp7 [Smittium culicis]
MVSENRTGRAIGPRSALTSFLKEQGISARMINERMKRTRDLREAQDRDSTEQNNDDNVDVEGSETDPEVEAGINSNDESVDITESRNTRSKTTKLSITSKEKKRNHLLYLKDDSDSNIKSKGKKKSKKINYDSDVISDNDDDFISPGNSSKNANDNDGGINKSSARKGGHIEFCSVCFNRFLVRSVKNSKSAVLCPKCEKSLNASKKTANSRQERPAPKRRNTQKKVYKVEDGLLEIDSGVPSLQDLCVRVVGRNIDNVESFGDISYTSVNKVSAIISKLRLLDNNTLKLFLAPDRKEITLYDCTKIDGVGYRNIAQFCPYLEVLNLSLCGKIRDPEILFFANHLKNLHSVDLYGPFLISDEAFAEFFKILGKNLVSLKISVAQFGYAAVKSLVDNCPNLEVLELNQCYSLDENCINTLSGINVQNLPNSKTDESSPITTESNDYNSTPYFKNIHSLAISEPQLEISSLALTLLVKSYGSNLNLLNVSNCSNADDDFLIQGVLTHCKNLNTLDISSTSITSKGITQFFDQLSININEDSLFELEKSSENPGIASYAGGFTHLNLGRVASIDDQSLISVIKNTSHSLKYLNIHSADEFLSEAGVLAIAGITPDPVIDINGEEGEHELNSKISSETGTVHSETRRNTESEDLTVDQAQTSNSKIDENNFDSVEATDAGDIKPKLSVPEKRKIEACKKLETLVLSYVRAVDDDVLKSIVDNCPSLTEVFVNGNPNVTPFAPSREGLSIIGRESDTL